MMDMLKLSCCVVAKQSTMVYSLDMFFEVLVTEPWASHMLGKFSVMETHTSMFLAFPFTLL